MNSENSTDQFGKRLRSITADLKIYIEKRVELLLLTAGEYMAGWIASSIHRVTGAVFLLGGLGFLLAALAIYLGGLLGHESLGYVIVSLPLLVAGGLFLYLKPAGISKKLEEHLEAEVMRALSQKELEGAVQLPGHEQKSESRAETNHNVE